MDVLLNHQDPSRFFCTESFVILLIFIVQTIKMHYIMALFFFPHLLGKTEEECSFHSVTAQYLSRK